MRTTFARGNIYVCGPAIDNVANRFLNKVPSTHSESRVKRDGPSYHITIAHKGELPIDFDDKAFVVDEIVGDVIPLGVGCVKDELSEALFVVIHSRKCCEIRAKVLGTQYKPKDFHITLGFSHHDIHSVPKGLSALLSPFLELSKADITILIQSSWKTVSDRLSMDEHLNVLEHVLRCTEESKKERKARILDVLCALYCAKQTPQVSLSYAQELANISPERGLVRKCLAYRDMNEPILANFVGIGALRVLWSNQRDDDDDQQSQRKTAANIVKTVLTNLDCPIDSRSLSEEFEKYFSSDENPWRQFADERTLNEFLSRLHNEFPVQEKELLGEMATTRRCAFDSFAKTVHRMPRFFSWIIPQRLCGMSTPRNKLDVQALQNCLSIGLVVSLTIETPLPEDWFSFKCKHLFIPLENYTAPSIKQVNEFILAATAMMLRKKAVLVHCGGGKGRAGTMLACWLVRMGQFGWDKHQQQDEDNSEPLCCAACVMDEATNKIFCPNEGCAFNLSEIEKILNRRGWRHEETFTAQEAIDSLRKWRPGSIETPQQETFIHEYASYLWKRQSEGCFDTFIDNNSLTSEEDVEIQRVKPYECAPNFANSTEKLIVKINPQSSAKIKSKQQHPSLILTVGLPGSGKSTLGRLLAEAGKKITILSGDEMGGKDAVERALGNAIRSAQFDGSMVYVDRCHPTPESRDRALSLAFNPNDAWAIFMDVKRDECIKRVDSRLDHPTVEIGSGKRVVETFAKILVPPECSEGFARVYHVKSLQALNELLESVFGVSSSNKNETKQQLEKKKEESNGPQRLPGFTKFPRTPHLIRLGKDSIGRDDLLISDAKTWLFTASKYRIVVEEKVDGANLGISIDPTTLALRVQNRSHYVTFKDHPQFSPLNEWLGLHQFEIRSLLEAVQHQSAIDSSSNTNNPSLFGEWMVAKHSIHYNTLSDYFLAFDILLPNGRFASRKLFNKLLDEYCPTLARVPTLHDSELERIGLDILQRTVTQGKSNFRKADDDKNGNTKLEGVYIRIDDGDFLKERSKIVRPDFITGNDHWTKHSIERNLKAFH